MIANVRHQGADRLNGLFKCCGGSAELSRPMSHFRGRVHVDTFRVGRPLQQTVVGHGHHCGNAVTKRSGWSAVEQSKVNSPAI